jgi:hypothetical protein
MPVPDVELVSSWDEVDAAAQAIANGVQKSQMAYSVRTSLGKADGAIQASAQAAATADMTQPVGIDGDGKLVTVAGLTADASRALLALLQKIGYTDANGQAYYDALYAQIAPARVLVSIAAVYTQEIAIYITDPIDILRNDLVVTATYDDGTSEVIDNYTLIGPLTAGECTVTVSYGGLTATFVVTVTSVYTGYVEVGSPSISGEVLTPGSSGSVRSPQAFSPGNYKWKIRVGFTTGATINTFQDVLGSVNDSGASQRGLLMENAWYTQGEHANQALLGAYISSAGSSWDIVAGTVYQQIQANTSYLYELEFTGSQYRARISSDNGDTWSDYISAASTAKVKGGYYIGVGLSRNGYFAGTIDLTSVMVWINDIPWWKAVL